MKKGIAITFLIAILAVGAFFRLNQINDDSLWLDEGITYYNSGGESYGDVWERTAELDQSPPAYYLVMHTYLETFGENEFGFRVVPLIFGLLSMIFLYLLMTEMFNHEIGLFAALLLAINPFHIGFSVESRMYVLLSLESLMAFYFFYKAMTHEQRGYGWWGLFTFASILGIYTHNFFIFSLLAFAAVFLVLLPASENKFGKFMMGVLSALMVIIAYLPWLPNFLKQLKVERYWMAPNELSNVKDYFMDFANQNEYVFWAFLGLSIFGVLWSFVRIRSLVFRKGVLASISLLTFLVVSLGMPLLYSLIAEPILKVRYVVYLLPILMGLCAIGIYSLRRFTMILPVMIFSLFVWQLAPWQATAYPIELGEDYRGLVEIVKTDSAPVVVHTPSIKHVINFYNQGAFEIKPFPYSDDLRTYNIDEDSKFQYDNLIKEFESFYLVVTHTHENPPGLLFVWSDARCDQAVEKVVSGMTVYHFSQCS